MNDSHVNDSCIILATKGCPGTGCDNPKNENRIIYWSHKCDSTSYLNKNAEVICFNCNTNYLILDAKFKCKYDSQYRETTPFRIGTILTALSSIESARVNISKFDRRGLENFLNNIADQLFEVKKR